MILSHLSHYETSPLSNSTSSFNNPSEYSQPTDVFLSLPLHIKTTKLNNTPLSLNLKSLMKFRRVALHPRYILCTVTILARRYRQGCVGGAAHDYANCSFEVLRSKCRFGSTPRFVSFSPSTLRVVNNCSIPGRGFDLGCHVG